jgi:DNA-binding NarL/FixJ family response regulator
VPVQGSPVLALGLEPDVVIMDVAMPSIDGDVATRRIKEQLPRTRVIALSTYKEPEVIERMYRAGAETYVLKTASPEDLLAAIRGQRDRLQVEVESSQGPVGSNDWPPRAPRNAVGWPDPGPPASPGTPHAATP